MVRVGYKINNNPQDEREFKNDEEFIKWLHRQLDIEPVKILFMEEK